MSPISWRISMFTVGNSPYTGMILSTRESPAMRSRLLNLGISQMSAGSKTDVGSYHKGDVDHEHELLQQASAAQGKFNLLDERPLDEVVKQLMLDGFVPSFCTA